MEESLGKKSYGTKIDTVTQSWFWLQIPKPGLGCTLPKIFSWFLKKIYLYLVGLHPRFRVKSMPEDMQL